MSQEAYFESRTETGQRRIELNTQHYFTGNEEGEWLGVTSNLVRGITVMMGAGDDRVEATEYDDQLGGGQGKDILNGEQGNDVLIGGKGADILAGEEGNDRLSAGAGDDELNAGDGNDIMYGGRGDDAYWGGGGADSFYIDFASGSDTIAGFDGLEGDRLYIRAGSLAQIDESNLPQTGSQAEGYVTIRFADGSSITLIPDDIVGDDDAELSPLDREAWRRDYIIIV